MFFIMNSWIFQTPAGIPRIAKNSLSGNANIQIYQWLLIYGQPKKTVKLQFITFTVSRFASWRHVEIAARDCQNFLHIGGCVKWRIRNKYIYQRIKYMALIVHISD
jgi:hypothetical protein